VGNHFIGGTSRTEICHDLDYDESKEFAPPPLPVPGTVEEFEVWCRNAVDYLCELAGQKPHLGLRDQNPYTQFFVATGEIYTIRLLRSFQEEILKSARDLLSYDWPPTILEAIQFLRQCEGACSLERALRPPDGAEALAARSELADSAVSSSLADSPTGLTNRLQRYSLESALDLKAFDPDSSQTASEIVANAEGSADRLNTYKPRLSELVDLGYLESVVGRGGGYFLTDKGRAEAERLNSRK